MSEDYEVGFGKPPKNTQFKPGQSGNPDGRPKKPKDIQAMVRGMMDSQVEVTVDGKQKKITVAEAMIMRLRNDVLSDKPQDRARAIKQLRDLCPGLDLSGIEDDSPPDIAVRIIESDNYGGIFKPTDDEKKFMKKVIRYRRKGKLNERDMFLPDEDDWMY